MATTVKDMMKGKKTKNALSGCKPVSAIGADSTSKVIISTNTREILPWRAMLTMAVQIKDNYPALLYSPCDALLNPAFSNPVNHAAVFGMVCFPAIPRTW
jgi:hypothetical protein